LKFAVVGAGAIGGYLGARLSVAGEQVTFIARNRNLEAINANGFRLLMEDGSTLHAKDVRAVRDMADAGPQDVVLLTVKAHQVVDLLPGLRQLFGPQTTLVSGVNGVPWWYFHRLAGPYEGRQLESVDPGGRIAAAIEPERVIGSVVYPAAELVAPGVVRVIEGNRFTIGEPDGSRSERVEALSQALMRAGFKAPVAKDIRSEIWVKLWGNLSFNPISALTHATLDVVATDPGTRTLARNMMLEAQRIGARLGVHFRVDVDRRINGAAKVGAHRTSMLQDLDKGRPLEIDALLTAVQEMGRLVDLETPFIDSVLALVQQMGRVKGHYPTFPEKAADEEGRSIAP